MSTFLSSLALYIFSMTHHKLATAFKGVLHRLSTVACFQCEDLQCLSNNWNNFKHNL